MKPTSLYLFFVLLVWMASAGCSIKNFRIQAGPPNVDSYKSFDNYVFERSDEPFCFSECVNNTLLGKQIKVSKGPFNSNVVSLEQFLQSGSTIAFAIIRNDTVIYEYYAPDYNEQKLVTSFSVAKSFVSAVLGVAIHEKYIGSVEDPITRYLPELEKRDKRFATIKIRHVLNHVAGINYPSITWSYYNHNHDKLFQKMKYEDGPGVKYQYDNGNTMLITYIIERATGKKFQDYFNEKIWSKIQAENEILWTLDSKERNNLKTFCCINGRLRDFAKFGRLYLNKGRWGNEQVIPEAWIDESIKYDITDASTWNNEYFWYLGPKEYGYYYAAGLYGQYIYIYPKKNVIILRFAKRGFHLNFMFEEQMIQVMDQL